MNIGTIQALNSRLKKILKDIDGYVKYWAAMHEGGKDACAAARLAAAQKIREMVEEQIIEAPKKEPEE